MAFWAGKKLQWDGEKMKIPNSPEAEKYLRREYRKGWELELPGSSRGQKVPGGGERY